MNGYVIKYRKPEWTNWATWTCKSKDEYVHVVRVLREEGYIIDQPKG